MEKLLIAILLSVAVVQGNILTLTVTYTNENGTEIFAQDVKLHSETEEYKDFGKNDYLFSLDLLDQKIPLSSGYHCNNILIGNVKIKQETHHFLKCKYIMDITRKIGKQGTFLSYRGDDKKDVPLGIVNGFMGARLMLLKFDKLILKKEAPKEEQASIDEAKEEVKEDEAKEEEVKEENVKEEEVKEEEVKEEEVKEEEVKKEEVK